MEYKFINEAKKIISEWGRMNDNMNSFNLLKNIRQFFFEMKLRKEQKNV